MKVCRLSERFCYLCCLCYPCYLCPVQVLQVSGNSAEQVLKVPAAEQVHSAEQVLYSVQVQELPPEQVPPSWVQA